MLPAEPTLRWRFTRTIRKLTRVAPDTPIVRTEPLSVYESATLNPLLFKGRYMGGNDSLSKAAYHGCEWFRFLKSPSMAHPQACWRKMFITQPPIKAASVHQGHEQFANPDGIKVWEIIGPVIVGETSSGDVDLSRRHLITRGTLLPTKAEMRMNDEEIQMSPVW